MPVFIPVAMPPSNLELWLNFGSDISWPLVVLALIFFLRRQIKAFIGKITVAEAGTDGLKFKLQQSTKINEEYRQLNTRVQRILEHLEKEALEAPTSIRGEVTIDEDDLPVKGPVEWAHVRSTLSEVTVPYAIDDEGEEEPIPLIDAINKIQAESGRLEGMTQSIENWVDTEVRHP